MIIKILLFNKIFDFSRKQAPHYWGKLEAIERGKAILIRFYQIRIKSESDQNQIRVESDQIRIRSE